MNLIVAVDKNWAIGCGNSLLQMIPQDMKYFKEKTLNRVVIMGRQTFLSLPKEQPLKDRENIVLSRDSQFNRDGIKVINSLDTLFDYIKDYKDEDVFVIGGEEIYKLLLPYCKIAYITKIDEEYEADKFFPNIDELKEWNLENESEVYSHKDIKFKFTIYKQTLSL